MAHSAAPAAEHENARHLNPSDMREVADSLPDDFADYDDSRSSDHEQHDREETELSGEARRAAEDLDLDEGDEAAEKPRRRQKAEPQDDDASEDEEAAGEAPESEEEAEEQPEDGSETETKDAKDAKPDRLNLKDDALIVIDGHEISGAEVKRGFLRQADYTRKTQEVAQERQQVQNLRQQIAAQEQELAQILDLATEVTRGVLPKAPDLSHYNTQDPAGLAQFLQDQQAYQQQVKGLETLVHARQSTTQQTEAQRQAALQAEQQQRAQTEQQQLQHELRLLQERTPELRTREGWNKLHADVEKYGKDFGLTPQDVNSFRDHRMFPVLMAALEMQKLKAAKPATVKQVQAAPPIRPAARQAGTRAADPNRSAQEQFRRNPNARTAAATLPDSWFE